MAQSLKHKTVSGMFWNSIQRFGTMSISFISNIVLARLLVPEDFGYIGMLMFFIAISESFIDSGFATALIQKKNPTQEDYSTIFYWNIFLSIFFVIVLQISAPYIADFYKMPKLCIILRVQSWLLMINAFSIIQRNRLVKSFDFKKLAFRNLLATSIATVVAIIMAYYGFGVWSLVARNLVAGVVSSITIWYVAKWKPSFVFAWKSFKELFQFGGLMFISYMLDTIYKNVQTLLIGKFYSAKDLGFYTQAKRMEEVPFSSLIGVINQVTFPAFAEIQDDLNKVKNTIRKNIKAIAFLSSPLSFLLIIIAKPLFPILITSKWDQSIPYFQILCVIGLIYSVNYIHTNVLKALGKGKLYVFSRLIKLSIGFISIFIGVQFSVMGMMIAIAISAYICHIVNMIVSKRIVNYGIFEQLKDLIPYILIACIAGVASYSFGVLVGNINNYLLLFSQSCIYILAYLAISYVVKLEGLTIFYNIIGNKFRKK